MITDFTQRWRDKRPIYRAGREFFNKRLSEIAAIDERTAKEFCLKNHYSSSFPVSRRRFGLFQSGKLVGVCVYSHPMNEKTITNVFGCERASDGLELGRLVLLDEIGANAESYFVAETFRRLRKEHFVGVVSFSDDMARFNASGEKTFAGHLGYVFQALNAAFLLRGTAKKIHLLPNGTCFSTRTISKIRAGESGWEYGSRILESYGADKCPKDAEARRVWLRNWLAALTRPVRHPGNLKYAWSFSKKIKLAGYKYPKIKICDLQRELFNNGSHQN